MCPPHAVILSSPPFLLVGLPKSLRRWKNVVSWYDISVDHSCRTRYALRLVLIPIWRLVCRHCMRYSPWDEYGYMTRENVRDYQRQRYHSLDQALVHWREQHIVEAFAHDVSAPGRLLTGRPLWIWALYGALYPSGYLRNRRRRKWWHGTSGQREQVPSGRGRWLHADIFALPFADATFDCTLSIRLLHHRFSHEERLRLSVSSPCVTPFCTPELLSFTPLHKLSTPLAWHPRSSVYDDDGRVS